MKIDKKSEIDYKCFETKKGRRRRSAQSYKARDGDRHRVIRHRVIRHRDNDRHRVIRHRDNDRHRVIRQRVIKKCVSEELGYSGRRPFL
jgi:hypothetical protein